MSHLETASFTNDDGTAINVPTSGVLAPGAVDPRAALDELKRRGVQFLQYPNEAAATNAAQATSNAWGHPEVPQDIYPLGLGKGLLTDILNFGLNNIYQYGQRAGEYNKRVSSALNTIQAGGDSNVSPLVGDIINSSPLVAGLINWSGMTDPAKAMIQRFGRAYPNMIGAMEKAPQIMEASIAKDLPSGVAGALSKPLPSAHFMEVAPNYADNLFTIGHEMQHSLNAPRVAATNPIDALTIGTLLHDVLPAGNRGTLNTVLSKQVAGPTLLQQLFGGPAKQQLRVTNPNRDLMRNAMDEGLAYLGQNAAEGKGGDLVKKLASRLGVNWENPGVRGQ